MQKRRFVTLKSSFILFLIISMSVYSIVPFHSYASSRSIHKTVKVAWFESDNFQEGESNKAEKKGYTYDYLQRIADYTGWEYEYEYGDWSTLYRKFLNGEIDLFASMVENEEREKQMEFPNYCMDVDHHYIYVREDEESMNVDDIKSFEGKVIGCIESTTMISELRNWVDETGADVSIRFYDSLDILIYELEGGCIDAFVGSENNVAVSHAGKPLVQIGSPESYLCVRKGANDLLTELNDALKAIQIDEPQFLSELKKNYYKDSAANFALSENEKEWIEQHSVISIGYIKDYMPFCGEDRNGNVTGVIKDYFIHIWDMLDLVDKVSISFQGFDSFTEMGDALRDGEIDISFPVLGERAYLSDMGIMASSEVIEVPMYIAYKGNYSEHTFDRIVLNTRPMKRITEAYSESEIIHAKDARGCLDAILKGDATCTVMASFRLKQLMTDGKYSQLDTVPFGNSMTYCIGVNKGNTALLSLMNRGVALSEDSAIVDSMLRYIESSRSYTVKEFARDNLVLVFFVAAIISGLIFLALIIYLAGVRRSQKAARKLNEVLENRMNIIYFLGQIYFCAYYIDLENDCYEEYAHINNVSLRDEEISNAQLCMNELCKEFVSDEYQEEILDFLDFSKMDERLKDRNIVTCAYIGKSTGWSQGHLIAGDRDENGKLKHVFFTARTIHEEKAKEELQKKNLAEALALAEHANHAKTRFLNNMSHDIRTPMNAIIGFTTLAESSLEDREKVEDYLGKIAISSQHLLALINDVLDMSRIESGKVVIDETAVMIPEIIHNIRTIIQPNIEAKQHGLFIDTKDIKYECIIVDKLRLNQILLNIMSNAVKFTPAGGEIRLSIMEKETSEADRIDIEFRIKDNGIGMSEEFKTHIFEPFSREQTSTVSRIQGTGLGMAITKNIVELMGGTIEVFSEEGNGTEFVVNLNCRVGEKYVLDESKREIEDFEGKKVLLVEDNYLNQEIAVGILKKYGLVVDVANDGVEALDLVRQKPANEYNLILMDIQMPRMDGYETTREIRQLSDAAKASIPIVAMTANAFDEDREAAFAVGMNGHTAKPIKVNEFIKTIAETIM